MKRYHLNDHSAPASAVDAPQLSSLWNRKWEVDVPVLAHCDANLNHISNLHILSYILYPQLVCMRLLAHIHGIKKHLIHDYTKAIMMLQIVGVI